MATRMQLRITLMPLRSQARTAQTTATAAVTATTVSSAAAARFGWIMQPPGVTSETIGDQTTSGSKSVRRARITRPLPPFYASWASALSAKVSEGQSWLSGATEQHPWRLRAHRAFLAVQRRIEPEETALGQIFALTQKARKYEQEGQQAEDALDQAAEAAADSKVPSTTHDPVDSAAVAQRAAAAEASSPPVAMPPPTDFRLVFLYPSSSSESVVRSSLRSFATERARFHSQRVLLFSLLVPVTAAATILPGPNIFLALVAFRLIGHYQAREGAKELEKLVGKQRKAEKENPTGAQSLMQPPQPLQQSTSATEAASSLLDPAEDVAPVELVLESYDDSVSPTAFSSLDEKLQLAQQLQQIDSKELEKKQSGRNDACAE